MSTVIEQFINLKSSIDISISNNPNSLIAPSPIFVPVTLSAPGIPVFAGPTAGILTLGPNALSSKTNFNLTYTWLSPASETYSINASNDGHSGGYLELYCPNRYFVEQKIVYEGGAVILNQSDGEFIIAGPQLSVRNLGSVSNPNLVIKLTQVSIEGNNNTIGGTGSKGVVAEMEFADSVAYNNSAGSDLAITIESKHGYAWMNYFSRTLEAAGLISGTHYEIDDPVLHSFSNDDRNYYTLTLVIHDVYVFDHTRALVTLTIGELGVI